MGWEDLFGGETSYIDDYLSSTNPQLYTDYGELDPAAAMASNFMPGENDWMNDLYRQLGIPTVSNWGDVLGYPQSSGVPAGSLYDPVSSDSDSGMWGALSQILGKAGQNFGDRFQQNPIGTSAKILSGLGGLYGSYQMSKQREELAKAQAQRQADVLKSQQPFNYSFTRSAPNQIANLTTAGERPGGVKWFNDPGTFTRLARGGPLSSLVRGPGAGQDDTISAKLSDGEYIMDADTVSALGDGSNEAGAHKLDQMRMNIRKHKRSAPVNKIPPKARRVEKYLKGK